MGLYLFDYRYKMSPWRSRIMLTFHSRLPQKGRAMHKTTKKWNFTKQAQILMLSSLGAATPTFTFDGCKVKCFSNNVTEEHGDQTLATLTECTFGGYAEQTLDAIGGTAPALLGPLFADPDNAGLMVPLAFVGGEVDAPGENIHGVYLVNSTEDQLLGYEKFDSPVPILTGGDYLQYDLILPGPYQVNLTT